MGQKGSLRMVLRRQRTTDKDQDGKIVISTTEATISDRKREKKKKRRHKTRCPLCPSTASATFINFNAIKEHLETSHSEGNVDLYACPDCAEALTDEKELKWHMNNVHPESPHYQEPSQTYFGLVCRDCGHFLRIPMTDETQEEWSQFCNHVSTHSSHGSLVQIRVHSTKPLEREPQLRVALPGPSDDFAPSPSNCPRCHIIVNGKAQMRKHVLEGRCSDRLATASRFTLIAAPFHPPEQVFIKRTAAERNASEEDEEESGVTMEGILSEELRIKRKEFRWREMLDKFKIRKKPVRGHPTIVGKSSAKNGIRVIGMRHGFVADLEADFKAVMRDICIDEPVTIPILRPIDASEKTIEELKEKVQLCAGCRTLFPDATRAAAHDCSFKQVSTFLKSGVPIECNRCTDEGTAHESCSLLGLQIHLSLAHNEHYTIDGETDDALPANGTSTPEAGEGRESDTTSPSSSMASERVPPLKIQIRNSTDGPHYSISNPSSPLLPGDESRDFFELNSEDERGLIIDEGGEDEAMPDTISNDNTVHGTRDDTVAASQLESIGDANLEPEEPMEVEDENATTANTTIELPEVTRVTDEPMASCSYQVDSTETETNPLENYYFQEPRSSYLPKDGFFFLCRHCMTVMPDDEELYDKHMEKHTEAKDLKSCRDCALLIPKDRELKKEHWKTHVFVRVLCAPCAEFFVDDCQYYLHLAETHSLDLVHFCLRCNRSTKSYQQLRAHIKSRVCERNSIRYWGNKLAEPGLLSECLLTFEGDLMQGGPLTYRPLKGGPLESIQSYSCRKPVCSNRHLVAPTTKQIKSRQPYPENCSFQKAKYWRVSCPTDLFPLQLLHFFTHEETNMRHRALKKSDVAELKLKIDREAQNVKGTGIKGFARIAAAMQQGSRAGSCSSSTRSGTRDSPAPSKRAAASPPATAPPPKQSRRLTEEEKQRREEASRKEGYVARFYTKEFGMTGTELRYSIQQRRATMLDIEVKGVELGDYTNCLFCHSNRGIYSITRGDRDHWIASFCNSRDTLPSPDYYKQRQFTSRKVCARHFKPDEIDDDGVPNEKCLPTFMQRTCLVCDEAISMVGLEMPIYYEDQLRALAQVPGCVRSLEEMQTECAREIQYVCPTDVIVASGLCKSAQPANFEEKLAAMIEKRKRKRFTAEESESDVHSVMRDFRAATSLAQLEPPTPAPAATRAADSPTSDDNDFVAPPTPSTMSTLARVLMAPADLRPPATPGHAAAVQEIKRGFKVPHAVPQQPQRQAAVPSTSTTTPPQPPPRVAVAPQPQQPSNSQLRPPAAHHVPQQPVPIAPRPPAMNPMQIPNQPRPALPPQGVPNQLHPMPHQQQELQALHQLHRQLSYFESRFSHVPEELLRHMHKIAQPTSRGFTQEEWTSLVHLFQPYGMPGGEVVTYANDLRSYYSLSPHQHQIWLAIQQQQQRQMQAQQQQDQQQRQHQMALQQQQQQQLQQQAHGHPPMAPNTTQPMTVAQQQQLLQQMQQQRLLQAAPQRPPIPQPQPARSSSQQAQPGPGQPPAQMVPQQQHQKPLQAMQQLAAPARASPQPPGPSQQQLQQQGRPTTRQQTTPPQPPQPGPSQQQQPQRPPMQQQPLTARVILSPPQQPQQQQPGTSRQQPAVQPAQPVQQHRHQRQEAATDRASAPAKWPDRFDAKLFVAPKDEKRFSCQLCLPMEKSKDTPRVEPRIESIKSDKILDALGLDKNCLRRKVLQEKFRSNRNRTMCRAHLAAGADPHKTGKQCDRCNQWYINGEKHLHENHDELRFLCLECGEDLTTEQGVLFHMKEHGFVIPDEYELNCPFKGDKTGEAEECKEPFKAPAAYKMHIVKSHGAHQLRHGFTESCPENHDCRLKFNTYEAWDMHKITVEKERKKNGIKNTERKCCSMCGTIDLWEESDEGKTVRHDHLHALEWTTMCKYDLMEVRRGNDAKNHFLDHHYESGGCKECPSYAPDHLNHSEHAHDHLIVGFSIRKNGNGKMVNSDVSRALLGIEKKH